MSAPIRVWEAGQWAWVKTAAKSKKHSYLQWGIAKLLKLPLLRPCQNEGDSKGLAAERAKLEHFLKAGFRVPRIVRAEPTSLYLEDLGPTVEDQLIQLKSESEKQALVKKLALSLADLHQHGLIHGAPMLRNIIVAQGAETCGWIDLEETPEAVMSFEEAAARDLLLMMWSVAKCWCLGSLFVADIFSTYLEQGGSLKVKEPINRVLK
ncbi:MAG: hypothetical protein EBX40_08495, partial [Gammaproteobacteria bacterium]|nr:hypothetical protein [Gammaproteobacteria bacterium]